MRKGALISILLILVLMTACTNTAAIDTANTATLNSSQSPEDTASISEAETTPLSEESSQPGVDAIDRADIKNEGVEIIEDQSFDTDLENWGKVRFVSTKYEDKGQFKARFYLLDEKSKVMYRFPDFTGNEYPYLDSIQAVAMRDVDGDGLKDIIIIAGYITGIGPDGTVPFPVCGIYFQKDKNFTYSAELDSEINDKGRNETIDMVVKYMSERGSASVDTTGSTENAPSQEILDKVGNYTEFIDTEKDNYDQKVVDLVGYSTEGGSARGYFNAGSLSYAEVSIYGEVGSVELFIYYIDDSLRYVISTTVNYDKPITEEDRKVTEENTTGYLIDGTKLYEFVEGSASFLNDTGLIETVGKITKEFD